jgi:hypothetical protein
MNPFNSRKSACNRTEVSHFPEKEAMRSELRGFAALSLTPFSAFSTLR